MLKRPKQRRGQQNTNSRHTASAAPADRLPPAFIFCRHPSITLSPLCDTFKLCLLSIYLQLSHCSEKTMVWCCVHTVLPWRLLPGYGMLKITNISPEEGISASNGTGLEGERTESGEGQQDGAGQRWCIIEEEGLWFWKHPAASGEQFKLQHLLTCVLIYGTKSLFFNTLLHRSISGDAIKGAEFHYSAIMTTKQSVECAVGLEFFKYTRDRNKLCTDSPEQSHHHRNSRPAPTAWSVPGRTLCASL